MSCVGLLVTSMLAAGAEAKTLTIGKGLRSPRSRTVKQIDSVAGAEFTMTSTEKNGRTFYLYLDVVEPSFREGGQAAVMLTFDYLDEGDGELFVSVDSSDPLYDHPDTPGAWKRNCGVQMLDSGTWKKAQLPIYDANFSGRLNGSDMRLMMKKAKNVRLRNIQVSPLEKGRHDMSGKSVLKDKPNILLIVVDDLNDYNGAFGDPNAKTPNINRFAQSGLRFKKAYCQYPVCGPSRASFTTGCYPETIGVVNNDLHVRFTKPDAVNMLEFFKEEGYWTASAGKIFHGDTNPMESGISTYQSDWFHDAEEFYLTKKFKPEFEARVGPVEENREAWDKHYKENYVSPQQVVQAIATEDDVTDEMHLDGRVRSRVCEHLEAQPFGDRPFFIACGFTRPHVPHFAPKRFFEMYDVDKLRFADVPLDDWKNKPTIAQHGKYKGYGAELGVNDRELRAGWLQSYLACISFVDEQIGRVLEALKNSGHEEDTIVIFMTDHGYHIGEHFMYGKFTLFEESTRIPLIFKVPGLTQSGTTTEAMTELVDIYPTLAELCGLEPPAGLDGTSLVPVLKNPETDVKEAAYTVMTRTVKGKDFLGKALHYKNWRYTEWYTPDENELYDLSKDPNEYNNLADNPEYEDLIRDLREMMKAKVRF
mgnify:CR=1 FL=1